MDLLAQIIDILLHVDRHLVEFLDHYGLWVYALLFAIIFAETGFVITPFLPGDSLLFAVGALATAAVIDVVGILSLLTAAAIIGERSLLWITGALVLLPLTALAHLLLAPPRVSAARAAAPQTLPLGETARVVVELTNEAPAQPAARRPEPSGATATMPAGFSRW